MTLTELLARVRQEVRDDAKEMFTDDQVTDYINEAQEDLANRQLVLTKTTASTTSDSTIPLPSDFIRPRSLRLGTTGDDDVEFVDDDVFWTWYDAGADPGHTIAVVHGSDIEVYPSISTSTAYSLRYFYRPADLSGANSSDLPVELHPKLIYFAIARCYMKSREFNAADRFMQMYEVGLRAHPQGRDRVNPGPITIHPAPSYWESSDYLGN